MSFKKQALKGLNLDTAAKKNISNHTPHLRKKWTLHWHHEEWVMAVEPRYCIKNIIQITHPISNNTSNSPSVWNYERWVIQRLKPLHCTMKHHSITGCNDNKHNIISNRVSQMSNTHYINRNNPPIRSEVCSKLVDRKLTGVDQHEAHYRNLICGNRSPAAVLCEFQSGSGALFNLWVGVLICDWNEIGLLRTKLAINNLNEDSFVQSSCYQWFV